MIELSGFSLRNDQNPNGDIIIEVVGLRPGEKLYEELLIGDNPMATEHPRIMKAEETFKAWFELEKELIALQELLNAGDVYSIYEKLKHLVSGFKPDAEIVDWISKQNKAK